MTLTRVLQVLACAWPAAPRWFARFTPVCLSHLDPQNVTALGCDLVRDNSTRSTITTSLPSYRQQHSQAVRFRCEFCNTYIPTHNMASASSGSFETSPASTAPSSESSSVNAPTSAAEKPPDDTSKLRMFLGILRK